MDDRILNNYASEPANVKNEQKDTTVLLNNNRGSSNEEEVPDFVYEEMPERAGVKARKEEASQGEGTILDAQTGSNLMDDHFMQQDISTR